MTPESCWKGCYSQEMAEVIFIGLSIAADGRMICFCSRQNSLTENIDTKGMWYSILLYNMYLTSEYFLRSAGRRRSRAQMRGVHGSRLHRL